MQLYMVLIFYFQIFKSWNDHTSTQLPIRNVEYRRRHHLDRPPWSNIFLGPWQVWYPWEFCIKKEVWNEDGGSERIYEELKCMPTNETKVTSPAVCITVHITEFVCGLVTCYIRVTHVRVDCALEWVDALTEGNVWNEMLGYSEIWMTIMRMW